MLAAVAGLSCLVNSTAAAEAVFYRAINLNGPALTIDGRNWEAKGTTNLTVKGSVFENQSVSLKPPTDPARARMIRSSVWGSNVDIEFSDVPAGPHQVFLYVWEDNHNEQFNILINDRVVLERFHSGSAGQWKKLGPWPVTVTNGKLKISGRNGPGNLSGVELWSGDGPIPTSGEPQFVRCWSKAATNATAANRKS
jgi:hypothetical protein